MTSIPELSVVMSVFNDADTLSSALKSILSQEGVGLEYIVIDDGSIDGSGKILDEFAVRDSRMKVVHKKNEGLTRALIEGCEMATAPWIARQDADDISLPGRLSAQLNRALQSDAPVLIGCGVRVRTPEGDLLQEIHPPTDTETATAHILKRGQAISSHGSILFSREAYKDVGGYREQFYYAQDIDLTSRLAESGPVAAIPEILYEYVYSPMAITGLYGRYQRAFYKLIRKGVEVRLRGGTEHHLLARASVLRGRCLRAKKKRSGSFESLYYLGSCLVAENPGRAVAYLQQAMAERPWSLKTAVRLLQAKKRTSEKIL